MKTENLENWKAFEKKIEYLEGLRGIFEKSEQGYVSGMLFRGQGNATWMLKTTLERYSQEPKITAESYFRSAARVKSQIETYTGKKWNVEFDEWLKWTVSADPLMPTTFTGLDFLIYLRHHGFPSPFLDWTRSPFVAAFFAFDEVPKDAERVAIYAYLEFAGQGKSQDGDDPVISTLPSNVPSHRRHFIQQSEYTICVAKPESEVIFSDYEEAFAKTDADQNLLWKFTLPVTERIKVLRKMDQMNVNRLSLFDNEESLMSTVALREFYLEKSLY